MTAAQPGDVSAPTADGPFDPSTDLGRQYLAVDWGATPLGSPEHWSDSLKSTVRLMLASRFAMWMGWGPQLTFFCNEGYRRDSLGEKYPWALGRPTAEVWSEIWDQITDRIDAVTVHGESTWDEELRLFVERSGYLEETFHTFSYSPVTEGDATISGLLCVVNEVTESVINARRIATLSGLSTALASAATVHEVHLAAETQLGTNSADFPFAAAYVPTADDDVAEIVWASGMARGRSAVPARVELAGGEDDAGREWSAALRTGEQVTIDVDHLLGELVLDDGASRPTRAVVVPLAVTGTDGDRGWLVVGASPHRPLDAKYLEFIRTVAEQFAAALGRARASEAERDQANLVAAREHAIAQELQRSLLPAIGGDADHLDVAGFYRSGVEGTQVGGDWYDVIDLGPGRTALVIGDVMGRGVQAAAVMGQLRASVRAYARLELPPDVLLGLLDETVREMGQNKIVTCVYAVYDPIDRSLTYANAGHLPPMLHEPGIGVRTLDVGGPPLGAGRVWPSSTTVTLPVGATLALYTDGLVERRDTDLAEGIDHLSDMLALASGPVAELPAGLVDELMPDGSDDDAAVLVARVADRAGRDRAASIELAQDPDQVARARRFVGEHLARWDIDEDLSFDAQLIVSELVTNALLHAHSGARLSVRATGARLFLEVHDDTATSPRPRNALPSDTNGRGLAIVAAIATRWGTRQTPAGKAVWCEVAVPSPPAHEHAPARPGTGR